MSQHASDRILHKGLSSYDFTLSNEKLGAGVDVSPWHDVPLESGNGTYNFICEIPKETSAKMEVATVSSIPGSPIARSYTSYPLCFLSSITF